MSITNISPLSQFNEGKRSPKKARTVYPFHLRNTINLAFNINTLIKDKEEALKPLDDLEDNFEEETQKINHHIVLVSERSSDSYVHILNDNIKKLQKELLKQC